MEYEMRNLQATDIFSVVKILNGIGLNNVKEAIDFEEINNIRKGMTEGNADVITSQVGLKVVMSLVTVIIQNLPKVETDLYNFVGNVIGVKSKDVAKMDMGEFMDVLIAIIQKDEFKDFFKRASKLIK